ncbi:MAG: hypothetical protein P1U53_17485 [Sulfitobacter sp.]|nr:hypothetical protein [Sulfitobacter sp.]
MIRALTLAALLLAAPAQADTVKVAKSTLELTDTDAKGAVAEIRWQNHSSDGFDRAAAVVHLAHGPVICRVNIELGAPADDSITVECNGYVPVPHALSTVDGSTSRVLIFPGGPMM